MTTVYGEVPLPLAGITAVLAFANTYGNGVAKANVTHTPPATPATHVDDDL